VTSHGTVFADPAKPHHWVEALKIAIGGLVEPKRYNPQTWQKAALILNKSLARFIASQV
jgi:hypothetical protein